MGREAHSEMRGRLHEHQCRVAQVQAGRREQARVPFEAGARTHDEADEDFPADGAGVLIDRRAAHAREECGAVRHLLSSLSNPVLPAEGDQPEHLHDGNESVGRHEPIPEAPPVRSGLPLPPHEPRRAPSAPGSAGLRAASGGPAQHAAEGMYGKSPPLGPRTVVLA